MNAQLNTQPRILMVDGEVALAEVTRDYLLGSGYRVDLRHTDEGVVDEVRAAPPDLMLLDVALPGRDGVSICHELRAASRGLAMMVSARVEEMDRLLDLEIGADDYICKPVRPREVAARVKAVLRRTCAGPRQPRRGGLELDDRGFRASFNGEPLDLTPTEYRLLSKLASETGRPLSRPSLLGSLYNDHRVVGPRTLDTHVKNLRRKLSPLVGERDPVRAVYGIGYQLDLG